MKFGITLETFFALIVLTLAEYRIALFVAEDIGPWRICEKFRRGFRDGWMRDGVECIGCVGFWVSFVATLSFVMSGMAAPEYFFQMWLACAGGICFLNRLAPCP